MGRVTAAAQPTSLRTGASPQAQPTGASTTFDLTTGHVAKAGTLAVLRKPSLSALAAAVAAAPGATAGIDVAAAGPAQVALLSELDALAAIVGNLRTDRDNLRTAVAALATVVNRSYLREAPSAYTFGSDLLAGTLPIESFRVDSAAWADLVNLTDGNNATHATCGGEIGDYVIFDLGTPQAISAVRYSLRGSSGIEDFRVQFEGRLSPTDSWSLIYEDPALLDGNVLYTAAAVDAGPFRYVKVAHVADTVSTSFDIRWQTMGVIGTEDITAVTFGAAPAAAERLLLDYVRED